MATNRTRVARMFSFSLACMLCAALTHGGELSPLGNGARYELELRDLEGRQVTLADYRGKVVLINFWASWCTPCVREMPGISRLQVAMQDHPFQVIGINVGETAPRARTAATRLDLEFPVLLDTDSTTFRRWGAEVLPTSYIVDPDGVTRLVAFGPLDWDATDVIATLRSLAAAIHPAQPTSAGP